MFRQNAFEPFAQRFADERQLAAAHHRLRTLLLVYLGVCALVPGLICALLSGEGLRRNGAMQRVCEGKAYPWAWRSDGSRPYASLEACLADRPLLRGEARDFALLAVVALAFGVLFVALGLWLRHRAPPALRVLRTAPESVVWVYGITYVARGTRRPMERVVCIATASAVTHRLRVADEATLDSVLDRVAALCPQAVLGHSAALAASFAATPGARPHDPAGAPGARRVTIEMRRR